MNRFLRALPLLALASLAPRAPLHAQDATPAPPPAEQPFEFALPWNDASKTVIDLSQLNPAPLREGHRLRAAGGHFRDGAGRRVRLLGVNITAGAAFPTREDAAQVAARLHKFGINCVRLHHMDATWATPNLFSFAGGAAPTRRLDPQSMDRLDYFVAQLKQHGIYVDLNLHVSRAWSQADGFADTEGMPEAGKVLSYFEPRAVFLQQEFATQILTHLNPHTGLSYARDPAVALIEMTNEDSLLGSSPSLATLPDSHRSTLQAQWNAWLRRRYATHEALLAAWNSESVPLGAEVLPDGRLAGGTQGWTLEQHEGTRAALVAEDVGEGGGPATPPGRALKLSPQQLDGTDWHLQLHRAGLDLRDGALYTLSFAARASASRRVGVNVRMDQAPWSMVGLSESIALGPQWQRFTFSFRASGPVAGHTRVSFVAGAEAGEVSLADFSLREGGGTVSMGAGERLEAGSVAMGRVAATAQGRDWARFLMDTEAAYVQKMKGTIRAAGSVAPLLCSQASYGGLGGVWRESQLDVIDTHAYWQHPNFPRQSWDMNDYAIPNTSMVRSAGGGTLSGLAAYREQGKPFMVSEYDHPAPNEYSAEEVPMVLATAAWQDWDGVFFFDYGSTSSEDTDRISSFFTHVAHPAKWAFLPSMARLWLSGALAPAPQSQVLAVPAERVAQALSEGYGVNYGTDFWKPLSGQGSFSPRSLWEKRSAIRFESAAAPSGSAARIESSQGAAASPSSIVWNPGEAGAEGRAPSGGVWSFACPTALGAAGFLGGASTSVGGASFDVAPSARGFAVLTVASLDSRPLPLSRSLLLTAIDKAENAGLQWKPERTSAAQSWQGPVRAYGVAAQVKLLLRARAARVFALDATGARRQEIACALAGGFLRFAIAPTDQAVWYEIAAS